LSCLHPDNQRVRTVTIITLTLTPRPLVLCAGDRVLPRHGAGQVQRHPNGHQHDAGAAARLSLKLKRCDYLLFPGHLLSRSMSHLG
jgi:hypothetical protein